jgi:hypothetical protein
VVTVIGRVDRFDSRYYQDPVTGDLFDSVTRIISATHSMPWLQDWAAKHAALFAVERLDFIAETIRTVGADAAVDLIKGQARRRREAAADRGSGAHAIVEALLLDQPIPQAGDPAEQAVIDAIVDGFLNFMTDHDPGIELAEATVANAGHGYAGTLDITALLRKLRKFGLIDVKTGANLDPTIAAQLAAYKHADEVWLDALGNKAPMPKVDACYVLHLRPRQPDGTGYDGGYKLYEVDVTGAFDWFLQMRAVFAGAQERSKLGTRVIYPPLPDGSQPLPLLEDIDGWTKARNLLIAAGMTTLNDVAAFTAEQLIALRGFGKGCLAQVGEMLAANGLALAEAVAA